MKHSRRSKKVKSQQSSESFSIKKENTLLAELYELLPRRSKKQLKAVLRDKQVLVDGRTVTQFDYSLKVGQSLEVHWDKQKPQEQPHGLNIIFEDEDLIIVDKPSGLLTVATDKEKRKTAYAILSSYVKKANPDNKIFIIHRIDRETSGLLMFAKNEVIKNQIQENWIETIEQRSYVAVVEGCVKNENGTIKSYLQESKAFTVYSSQNPQHGKEAITHYTLLKKMMISHFFK